MDAALDAMTLLIAARLGGGRIRPVRMLIAALTGAVCALLCRVLALSRIQTALLWLPTAFVMQLIAQGKAAAVRPVRYTALLLCAAGLLGGTVSALAGAIGSLFAAYALGCICMAVMTINLTRAQRALSDVRRAKIICRYRGQTVHFEGMVDSGNTLRDYLTHFPVIVIPEKTGRAVFRLDAHPLRPIFADTAGGRQMMDLLVPQETMLFANGQKKKVYAAVALCGALSKGAPALVPASLTEGLEIKSGGG